MPSAPSATAYALLGLLSLRPWTTYELAQQTERSLNWFWPRTPRKIYDEAKRLAEAGLATTTEEFTGQRPRTVYRITAEGRRALAQWLAQDSAPPKLESEALVRVFFADGGTLDDLQATLERFALEAQTKLEVLTAMTAANDEPDYPFRHRRHVNALGLRFQLDHHRSTAAWARWALEQTRQWVSTTDPGTWQWQSALAAASPDPANGTAPAP